MLTKVHHLDPSKKARLFMDIPAIPETSSEIEVYLAAGSILAVLQ